MSIEWIQGSPEELQRKFRSPELIQVPTRRFLERAALTLQGLARERAPVDRGRLRQSITFDVDSSPMPLYAKIGTNVQYAPAMEYGTNRLSEKPSVTGNVPFPTGPELDVWARRHGFEKGEHVASIIRWKGGVNPRRFLRDAFRDGKAGIHKFLRQLERDIERAWEHGV